MIQGMANRAEYLIVTMALIDRQRMDTGDGMGSRVAGISRGKTQLRLTSSFRKKRKNQNGSVSGSSVAGSENSNSTTQSNG